MQCQRTGATPSDCVEGSEPSSRQKMRASSGPSNESSPEYPCTRIFTAPVEMRWAVMAVIVATVSTFRLCELAAQHGFYFGLCPP